MKNRILGVDPGLVETGWSIVDIFNRRLEYIASGVIKTDINLPIPQRLLSIHQGITTVIEQHEPMTAAIENTYVNSNFASSLKLAHARAASMLPLAAAGLTIEEYPAKTVKKCLVGNGKADKEQMQAMLKLLLGGMVIKNNNEADAVAIAICHAYHI